jgi:hypothetical protein
MMKNETTTGYAVLVMWWDGTSWTPDDDGITVYRNLREAEKVKRDIELFEGEVVRVTIIPAEVK